MEVDVVHKEPEQNHVVEPPLASVAERKEETEALMSEPAAPNNLWIKKYLILKSKCDQIDQVCLLPLRPFIPLPLSLSCWLSLFLLLSLLCVIICALPLQSNDVLYAKSRQIYKMIQRAEAEKK